MNTAGVEFIRNEMDWDKYDPWGSVQSARFDLAEAFWHHTGLSLGYYSPSVLLIQGEPEEQSRVSRIYGALEQGIVSWDDIYYWDRVLDQMRDLVILAGRDY